MTISVLLTLGRLPKALELARALDSAGASVFIAEPFGLHLCRPSRSIAKSFQVPSPKADSDAYKRALISIITEHNIDLVIPISEEALHVVQIAADLPPGVQLYAPTAKQLEILHNKLTFNRLAQSIGLSVPKTFWANEPDAQRLAETCDYVLKPSHGCSGNGLSLRTKGMPLTKQDQADGMIIQERIHGRLVSSQSIAHNGEIQGTALYEGLVFAGTVATCFERVDDQPDIIEWIKEFVTRTNHSGFIAFDFIVDERGAFAIECNPRLTSGLHFMNPADIAHAVLQPNEDVHIALKPQRRFQEGHTTLTEAYGAFLRPREFLRRLGLMASAKDVLFSLKDPLPFLLMTPMSWDLLKQVMFEGCTFGEAATRDIEWSAPPSLKQTIDGNTEHPASPQDQERYAV